MNASTVLLISKILDFVLVGAQIALEAQMQAEKLNAKLRQLAKENRDPTPEELAEIESHTEAVLARIAARAQEADR